MESAGKEEKMWREKQDSDWCQKLIKFPCGTFIYFLLSSFLRRFVSPYQDAPDPVYTSQA